MHPLTWAALDCVRWMEEIRKVGWFASCTGIRPEEHEQNAFPWMADPLEEESALEYHSLLERAVEEYDRHDCPDLQVELAGTHPPGWQMPEGTTEYLSHEDGSPIHLPNLYPSYHALARGLAGSLLPFVRVNRRPDGSDEHLQFYYNSCFERGLERMTHGLVARILCEAKAIAAAETPAMKHAPDFAWVIANGRRFSFSKGNQAEAVRVLWEDWRQGGHGLSEATIHDKIGSQDDHFRLAKVFRTRRANGKYQKHMAWGTLIKSVGKGIYALFPQDSPIIPA